jgi:hypothetical protein
MKSAIFFCLLIFVLFPQLSYGCKPVAVREYKVPTKDEEYTQADIVFSGKVIRITKIYDIKGLAIQHPSTYKLSIHVEKWLKGSGEIEQEVFDTTGTDCDSTFGVNHIVVASDPRSTRWLVYIAKHQGQLWVRTSEQLK